MARGKPLILTPIAAEGLDVTDGREAFIEHDAARIAAGCVRLLDDLDLATAMGLEGRRTWDELHRPELAMQRIGDIVTGAIANGTWSGPARGWPGWFSPASQAPAESQT